MLPLILALGCSDARPEPPTAPRPAPEFSATRFDPATAGSIRGRVAWDGDLPVVAPFDYRRNLPSGNRAEPRLVRENPYAPVIDAGTRGVAGAVLVLHGVEGRHPRPWDHPPVRVEHRDRRLHVVQGKGDFQTGFVRRGDTVEMVSREEVFNTVRGSGAAFFSLTLPDPDRPRRRAFQDNGVIELSSGAGYYWMRAFLFVDDHPYYARTDAAGGYELTGVPPGTYQVMCWMPNWNVARHERDPETTVITRLFFRPPVQREKSIEVRGGVISTVNFTRSRAEFEK